MGYVRKERTQERRQAVLTGEKKKTSEGDSTRSLKSRRNEKELERIDDKPTPDIEGQNSKDDSDEQPDVHL